MGIEDCLHVYYVRLRKKKNHTSLPWQNYKLQATALPLEDHCHVQYSVNNKQLDSRIGKTRFWQEPITHFVTEIIICIGDESYSLIGQ